MPKSLRWICRYFWFTYWSSAWIILPKLFLVSSRPFYSSILRKLIRFLLSASCRLLIDANRSPSKLNWRPWNWIWFYVVWTRGGRSSFAGEYCSCWFSSLLLLISSLLLLVSSTKSSCMSSMRDLSWHRGPGESISFEFCLEVLPYSASSRIVSSWAFCLGLERGFLDLECALPSSSTRMAFIVNVNLLPSYGMD